MLVIEGNKSKLDFISDIIDSELKTKNSYDIIVIDNTGNEELFNHKVDCYVYDGLLYNFVEDFNRNIDLFHNAEIIILSLEAPKTMIKEFKCIQKQFSQTVWLTVKNYSHEDNTIYSQ